MIQPGLSRISKLLAGTQLPWRAVHVAGTNGKGSICNYIASMLRVYNETSLPLLTGQSKVTYGKFTSPHLIDRWDGITINDATISRNEFELLEASMAECDKEQAIDASEFELLTATAFVAFTKANVDLGIVEVGMGGSLDATNILGQPIDDAAGACCMPLRAQPLVTAISKIGLDHQAFLGNTLEEIAAQKAGIMKPLVPVVYDESNPEEVTDVLTRHAASVEVQPVFLTDIPELVSNANRSFLPAAQITEYQTPSTHTHVQHNTSVALRSTWLALSQLGRLRCPSSVSETEHMHILHDVVWKMSMVSQSHITPNPGRLQRVSIEVPTASGTLRRKLLLDGAHNAQSAVALADEIAILRGEDKSAQPHDSICWIIAISQGRNIEDLLTHLLKPGDSVRAVEFGPVDGMPWVRPIPAQEIGHVAAKLLGNETNITLHDKNVQAALDHALSSSNDGWTAVAGSLYLIGDVHRLLRKNQYQLHDDTGL